MATTMQVRTGDWNELFGVWIRVRPDPLTGTGTVLITVHVHGADLWVYVKGPNGGVHLQTIAPDSTDHAEERL